MSEQRLTVVIPAWDSFVSLLPRAIASFERQDFPEVRILVADNASRVPVPPMEGVQVLRTPSRLSVGAIRNWALQEVDTPWVLFWDADDQLTPGTLAALMQRAEGRSDVVAVASSSVGWNSQTGAYFPWRWPRRWAYTACRARPLFALAALFYNPFPTTGPTVLRTQAVRDARGFSEDVDYAEDWGLSAALAIRGRVIMLRRHGRIYTVHAGSLSNQAQVTPLNLQRSLRSLRHRVAADPASPPWLKWALPAAMVHHRGKVARWSSRRSGAGFYREALDGEDKAAPTG